MNFEAAKFLCANMKKMSCLDDSFPSSNWINTLFVICIDEMANNLKIIVCSSSKNWFSSSQAQDNMVYFEISWIRGILL